MKYKLHDEEKRIRENYRNSSFKNRKPDYSLEEFFAIQELEEHLYEERKKNANCLKEGFCGRLNWENCNDIECGMNRFNEILRS